jgi:hypothetical protein
LQDQSAGFTIGTGCLTSCSHRPHPPLESNSSKQRFGSRVKLFVQKVLGDNHPRLTYDIGSYIPCLIKLNKRYIAGNYDPIPDTSGLSGFAKSWKNACCDPAFINAQLTVYDDLCMKPAEILSDHLDLSFVISRIVLFDSYIQHGESGLDRLLAAAGPISACRINGPGEI